VRAVAETAETKRAERRRRPLAVVLTAGQAAGSPRCTAVVEPIKMRGPGGRPRLPAPTAPQAVIPANADQAANRKQKGSRGGRPVTHDAAVYKECDTVERRINKIKDWCGLATRYDKTPAGYLAGLHLRGAFLWMRSLQPTS
jgi:transposase